jgi:hypothetical protein
MVNEPPAPGGSKVERFWTNLWRSSKFDNFGSSKTIKKMWPEGAHFQLVCNIILYVCLSVPLFLGNCWSDFTWDFVRRSESKKMGFVACCMHNCTEISRIIRNRELTNLNFSIYMNSVYFLYINVSSSTKNIMIDIAPNNQLFISLPELVPKSRVNKYQRVGSIDCNQILCVSKMI